MIMLPRKWVGGKAEATDGGDAGLSGHACLDRGEGECEHGQHFGPAEPEAERCHPGHSP
jgi:hypothetical protein